MSILFALILIGSFAATVLWWVWADRRVHATRIRDWQRNDAPSSGGESALQSAAYCWARTTLGAFSITFVLGFVWLVLGRLMPETLLEIGILRVPPTWLMAFLMLWAILVLPLVAVPSMLLWVIWWLVRKFGQVVRWTRPSNRHDGDLSVRPANVAWLGASHGEGNSDAAPASSRLTRRQLLAGTLATAPVWTTLGLTGVGLVQKRHFRIRDLSVRIPSLPAALDGLTIAHVSDTHVGKFTQGEILNRIADATNDLAADFVLLTGDLIDHSVRDLPEAVRMLDRMDRRSGMFLIEGNHDLFDGRAAFAEGLRAAGMPLLLNETATVQLRGHAVQFLGMIWHGRDGTVAEQVESVVSQRDPAAFPILLAHHPHALDRAAQLGIPLTLAGHTHGGQLMLTPEFGAGPALFKYWSGIYERGASRLVVSNGAGNWFPLRTNAPAEIIHLTLRRA